ncbi:cupredoxin domain-containing protein [Roseivivax isoporae]|uniref:Uncharacterized protein n=1 Tax=Roseivivax isoporae LMG 25204 TaxID=1449351 RepID=X7FDR0_9RHOB|nr:hypothetical protein [Roseivivax isoporae]ETX30189.1 hypothetical protein RISW2_18555 [Roseivivax isoporae LMG 25204]
MLRKTAAAAVLALASLTQAAMAEEHEVLMLGFGYFPEVIHPVPGDTIRFVNAGNIAMAATATDESWSTGLMIAGAEVTVPVVDGMTRDYDNRLPADLVGTVVEATPELRVVGRVAWDEPSPDLLDLDGRPSPDAVAAIE